MKSLYIGVDFDGTIVKHKYPEVGKSIEGALDVMEELIAAGHKLILYTMRSGDRLQDAVDYLEENGIVLYGVNENPSQKYWTESVKIFCNYYIDDASINCPLIQPEGGGRPYADWEEIRELLIERGVISE